MLWPSDGNSVGTEKSVYHIETENAWCFKQFFIFIFLLTSPPFIELWTVATTAEIWDSLIVILLSASPWEGSLEKDHPTHHRVEGKTRAGWGGGRCREMRDGEGSRTGARGHTRTPPQHTGKERACPPLLRPAAVRIAAKGPASKRHFSPSCHEATAGSAGPQWLSLPSGHMRPEPKQLWWRPPASETFSPCPRSRRLPSRSEPAFLLWTLQRSRWPGESPRRRCPDGQGTHLLTSSWAEDTWACSLKRHNKPLGRLPPSLRTIAPGRGRASSAQFFRRHYTFFPTFISTEIGTHNDINGIINK